MGRFKHTCISAPRMRNPTPSESFLAEKKPIPYGIGLQKALGATIAAVLIAIAAMLPITQSVTRPLSHAVEAMSALEQGDLTHRVNVVGRDEVATLMLAVGAAFSRLAALANGIKTSVDVIRRICRNKAICYALGP